MKALILNGKVVETAAAEFEVHESMTWVDAPDEVQHGWSYDGTSFVEPVVPQPSYDQLRAAEYPPITDYLDGVVKGDQAQIAAYIAACQAVKAKYPKGA
jgi:hypothetical protein